MKRSLSFLKAPFFRVTSFISAVVFAVFFTVSMPAYAVHDLDIFELDNGDKGANAIDEELILNADFGPPADWAQNAFGGAVNTCDPLLNSCGYVAGPDVDPENPPGGAFRSLFIQDATGNTDDVFFGGGSKDDLDVSNWQWETKSAPDKDDLLPIAAAGFMDDEDLLIYLAGTLDQTNGSAAIGAWLFLNNIGICADGTFGIVNDDGDCLAEQPDELHRIGDVFVVAEMYNGGTNVQMQVFTWVGDDAAARATCEGTPGHSLEPPRDNLCKVLDEANATCTLGVGGLSGDDACGVMNQVSTESPDDWGYQAKSQSLPDPGPAEPAGTDGIQENDFPPTSLFEAGFNFSNLFPEGLGCFNSFLMNTRTSHSVRAQLKDLGLGKFPLCGISVEKTGPDLSKPSDEIVYTYTITNTGAITLYRTSILDDVIGDLTALSDANVIDGDCAVLAPQASCTFTATYTVPADAPDPLINEVTVLYNTDDDGVSGDSQSATDDHEVELFQPSYELAKYCPEGVDAENPWIVGVEKDFRFSIDNTSSSDSPDLVLQTLTDALLGDAVVKAAAEAAGAGTLAWDDETVTFTVPYTPTAADAATGYVVNSFATVYKPDGFPNELNQDASTDQCPVVLREAAIVTEVHADLLEDDPDAGPHVNVTFLSIPSTTPTHDHVFVSDATAAASGGAIAPITPTGDLTIRLFADGACLQSEVIGEGPDGHEYPLTISLSSGEAETNTFALPVGTLGWLVSYEGDGYFEGVDHECEPITGLQRDTQTVTYIHEGQPNAAHSADPVSIDIQNTSVPVGTKIHDSALVSQLSPIDSLVPTGSVDFLFFNSHADCENDIQVIASSENAGLTNGYAESAIHEITDIGTGELAYQAVYVPADENFNSSTSACELLDIELNPSTITTEVHDDLHNIVSYDTNGGVEIAIGTEIHDWAKVTGGGLAPYDPTGTVTFELYLGLACEGEPVDIVTADLRADATNDATAVTETLDAVPPLSIVTISGDEFSFMASYGGDGVYAASSDSRCEPVKVQQGLEGCTPGYWKQTQHFGNWVGYNQSDMYDDVFGAGPAITLLEAAESGGNTNSEALLRHSVAALLNAAGDVNYAYSEQQVIDMVYAAWMGTEEDRQALHIQLAEANERDCPLSRAEAFYQ